jgi:hypothetical protein
MGEQGIEQVPPKNLATVPIALRTRITHLLHSRRAPSGSRAAMMEDKLKTAGLRVWNTLEKRPLAGAALVSGIGLVAASAIGAGELTLTVVLGVSAYQVFRERRPPKQAAQHVLGQVQRATTT